MAEEKKNIAGIIYECVQCESKITAEQLSIMLAIKCPNCGYWVLRKTRAPVVKMIKAR